MATANTSVILLQRSGAWTYRIRKFKVLIDGKVTGTIASGVCERYIVTPGKHRVQIRIDRYSSGLLELDLATGEETHLECGTKEGMTASFSALVSPSGYLLLHEVGATRLDLQQDKREEPANASSIHIFISYRRQDSPDVCGRIYDRLVQKFGKQAIFKDVDSIPIGVDFRAHLDSKIAECDVLLVIIGDCWIEPRGTEGRNRLFDSRDYVKTEIESALKRNIPVVPLLVRGAQLPGEAEVPDSVKPLIYQTGMPIRADPDFHNDMDRLIDGLLNTSQTLNALK